MSTIVLNRFNLKREPFSAEIEPHALFSSQGFQQGRLRLEEAVHRRGLALVAGEPGSGKTALVRSLLTRLDSSSFRMLYGAVPVAKNSLHAPIEGLLLDLGEKVPFNNAPRALALLRESLRRQDSQGRRPVLVLDDAHHLGEAGWLGLKTLTNCEMDSRMPFTMLLLGAGCERLLFSREVARDLHRRANGLPRKINQLAYNCLTAAALEGKELVDQPCLEQATSELAFGTTEAR
ncbi:MAG: ExeA family protein [Candidatus Xenobium sp.]|jgi:type II secretory pathway predicted ATPase ExeA|nr:AAA family ATPase [Burkholderiales bacterium]